MIAIWSGESFIFCKIINNNIKLPPGTPPAPTDARTVVKTKTESEDPYWLYQEGQILLNKYYEEDFLYLYSFKNRHYGLNLKRYNLNRIKDYDEVIYLEKRRSISHLKTGNVLKGDDLAEVETLLYENDDEFILEPPTFKRLI